MVLVYYNNLVLRRAKAFFIILNFTLPAHYVKICTCNIDLI